MSSTYFAGNYPLPRLTERDEEAIENKQYHKLRSSAHVQKMEELIAEGLSVSPDEVDRAVFHYDEPEELARGERAFLRVERDEDGDLAIFVVPFLGGYPHPEAVTYRVVDMDADELLRERFEHVPPRSVL